MRAVILLLMACGADEPADACTDAVAIHMDVNECGAPILGACSPAETSPRGCAVEACQRHEMSAGCVVQFDTWITCLEDPRKVRAACACSAEGGALLACVGE